MEGATSMEEGLDVFVSLRNYIQHVSESVFLYCTASALRKAYSRKKETGGRGESQRRKKEIINGFLVGAYIYKCGAATIATEIINKTSQPAPTQMREANSCHLL